MPILSWIGALVVLLVGALTLNGVGQSLEGRDSVFIHFGWVTLILLVGGALFPFWGWTSTGWVLGVAAAWSIVPPVAGRLLGDGVPSGYLYHGDPHGTGDAEESASSDKNSGNRPSKVKEDESIAQVVPYFAESLGDSECYFHGHAVARNCEELERLADRIGTRRLSSFGFNDDLKGETLAWHPADVGLKSVTDLLNHLSQLPVSGHSDNTPDRDLTEIADDLGRFESALHSAEDALMLDHLDYEAMLPFQLFAAPILLFAPPVVGALTAFFYALGILLLAQFMILTPNVRSPSWAASGLLDHERAVRHAQDGRWSTDRMKRDWPGPSVPSRESRSSTSP